VHRTAPNPSSRHVLRTLLRKGDDVEPSRRRLSRGRRDLRLPRPNGAGKTRRSGILATLLPRVGRGGEGDGLHSPGTPRRSAGASATSRRTAGPTRHERRGELVMQGRLFGFPSRGHERAASCLPRSSSRMPPTVPSRHSGACAAASTSPWHGPPPGPAVPRRADHRPRPAGPRPYVDEVRGQRRPHHRFPHDPLPRRGGRPVRPARDHRPRPDRGRGHAAELKRASRGRRHDRVDGNGDSSHG